MHVVNATIGGANPESFIAVPQQRCDAYLRTIELRQRVILPLALSELLKPEACSGSLYSCQDRAVGPACNRGDSAKQVVAPKGFHGKCRCLARRDLARHPKAHAKRTAEPEIPLCIAEKRLSERERYSFRSTVAVECIFGRFAKRASMVIHLAPSDPNLSFGSLDEGLDKPGSALNAGLLKMGPLDQTPRGADP